MPLACADERAALEMFETQRWGGTPCCVHCGDTNVYTIKDRESGERRIDGRWRCRGCGKQYTVRVGQIMEESPIPLHKWAYAFWAAASSKNGVSALEMSRKIQISYKSALFMMNRIRWAMTTDPTPGPKLTGTVEADETYVGGRPRHRRTGITGNHPGKPKTPVFAAVQRGGSVRTRVLANVTANNLRDALTESTDTSARLVTDDLNLYWAAGKPFARHDRVKHSKKEYVNAADPTIHTNTIESFFARVKRQINGTYHAVSKEHLHRYVGQAAWLYNTRGLNDGERITNLIRSANGRRLMAKAC